MSDSFSLSIDWARLITEQIEEDLFSLDRQWRITYVNNHAVTTMGKSREELIGRVFWEVFPEVMGTSLNRFYHQVMAENKAGQLEFLSPTDQHWYDVRAYPQAEGLIVYYQDINSRKTLESQIQESETRFRTLSEAALEGIVVYQNDTIVEINHNILDMFGYSSLTELIGQPVAVLFTPDSLPAIQKRVSADSPEIYEISGRRKDNTTFPLERRGKATEYQGKPARVIVLRDLSYQKQVEQTLRESEQRYRILSEAAFEGLIVHDNGSIRLANEAMAQMTGYTLEELTGMTLFQLVTPQTRIELRERLTRNLDMVAEGQIVRKDGRILFVEVRSRVVEYQGRQVRLVAVRDVTEIKQAEEALKKTEAQLVQSQKLEGIGRLAGGIAHDFNNLLTAISGYAELAITSVAENSPLYDDLNEIVTAAERASALTRQLLIFSRQQITQPRLLNLNQIVTEMDRLLQRLLGEDVDLVCLLEPELGEALGDPHQLEQVIMNLAVNARDAMPEGGKLTIETANVELDEAYRAAGHPQVKTGSYVMLAVSDTGTGMDETTQQKIFEPFFTTKPVGQGTGLGLSTVYGIVKEAGGYIFLYSEVGQGTSFKVYLPRLKTLPLAPNEITAPALTMQSATQTGADRKMTTHRILVVEDDALVRELVYKVLTEAGHRPILARDGQEALALLNTTNVNQIASSEEAISLVITDIIMPQMSGRALIEELRQQWPTMRVICMSGYTEKVVDRHELLKQCQNFLQKPFTPRVLLERIEAVMCSKS